MQSLSNAPVFRNYYLPEISLKFCANYIHFDVSFAPLYQETLADQPSTHGNSHRRIVWARTRKTPAQLVYKEHLHSACYFRSRRGYEVVMYTTYICFCHFYGISQGVTGNRFISLNQHAKIPPYSTSSFFQLYIAMYSINYLCFPLSRL